MIIQGFCRCLPAKGLPRPAVERSGDGIEVSDLRTGRVVSRWRTHLGPRLPVIDAKHGLVYITATFGPDIWVFDRKSMRPLGRVPVGVGARNALLSSDGRAYFAGTAQAHFVWDADTLAKRFGRRALCGVRRPMEAPVGLDPAPELAG